MPASGASAASKQKAGGTIHLGQLFGIDIRLHFSVLVIFALIITSLATGVFPTWHPDWPAVAYWGYGLLAALLFFASLLTHELAHSVTARWHGVGVEGITLFLFGGVAQMHEEPSRPRDELLIAAAGPAASMVLGVLFGTLAVLFAPDLVANMEQSELDLSALPGFATVMLWLSGVNWLLAVFNLLPGFPMDGGRVFRAALWWQSGDYVKATKRAAAVGGMIGWLFVIYGVVLILNAAIMNGLWMMLIGWFVRSLAGASVTQLVTEQALRQFTLAEIMRTRFERVPADLSLADFLDSYLLRSRQLLWPVQAQGEDVGYISLGALEAPVDPNLKVADVMTPMPDQSMLTPDMSALDAFRVIAEQSEPSAVLERGRVVGLVHHADVLRWLAVRRLMEPSAY